jgi:cell division septation protein DedD
MLKKLKNKTLFLLTKLLIISLIFFAPYSENNLIKGVQAACSSANCSSTNCPAGCPGDTPLTYASCFDNSGPSLTCTYDPDYCDDAPITVPCPEECDPPCDGFDPYCTESNPGCGTNGGVNGWNGVCFSGGGGDGCIGDQHCIATNDSGACFSNEVTVNCCDAPAPTSPPADPDPTTPPGATATPIPPSPTPTAGPVTFSGYFYEDASAVASGLGGTDNLCSGATSSPVFVSLDMPGTTVTASRTGGESTAGTVGYPALHQYTITANTSNSDYTLALQLPFPPPDPDNAWQCACNADPGDPYRCLYTNQTPSNSTNFNFFLKRANVADNAWFQTLGGSSWAANNIESLIPSTTCIAPACQPALIASDPAGNSDSAGFPLTQNGVVITSTGGDNYIHESGARTTSAQGQATGVTVPIENYDYFYEKVGDQAQVLASSDKPIVGADLEVFKYTGNLTIDETSPWSLLNTEKIVVFVDGDLILDDTVAGENRLITVPTDGDAFLMFVVSGDITVTASVGYTDIYTDATQADISNVEGVFVADGVLTIAGLANTTDRKFIGAGTFVGWEGVVLGRNFDDGASPTLNDGAATETFIFRPDFIVNAPKAVKSAQMTWREVEPSF